MLTSNKGNLADTRAAWEELIHKAAQAEVQFVHGKAQVWLGRACLDAGHVSEAISYRTLDRRMPA